MQIKQDSILWTFFLCLLQDSHKQHGCEKIEHIGITYIGLIMTNAILVKSSQSPDQTKHYCFSDSISLSDQKHWSISWATWFQSEIIGSSSKLNNTSRSLWQVLIGMPWSRYTFTKVGKWSNCCYKYDWYCFSHVLCGMVPFVNYNIRLLSLPPFMITF